MNDIELLQQHVAKYISLSAEEFEIFTGFTTTVIGDACATRDRELYGAPIPAAAVQQAYLAGMTALGGLYANVITTATFINN